MIYFKFIAAVRDLDSLPLAQKCVLYTLASYCTRADGRYIFPIEADAEGNAVLLGQTGLARKCGMKERAFRTAYKTLLKEGWIAEEDGRKGHCKGYALCLEKLGLTLPDMRIQFGARESAPELPALPDEWGNEALRELPELDQALLDEALEEEGPGQETRAERRARLHDQALETFQRKYGLV